MTEETKNFYSDLNKIQSKYHVEIKDFFLKNISSGKNKDKNPIFNLPYPDLCVNSFEDSIKNQIFSIRIKELGPFSVKLYVNDPIFCLYEGDFDPDQTPITFTIDSHVNEEGKNDGYKVLTTGQTKSLLLERQYFAKKILDAINNDLNEEEVQEFATKNETTPEEMIEKWKIQTDLQSSAIDLAVKTLNLLAPFFFMLSHKDSFFTECSYNKRSKNIRGVTTYSKKSFTLVSASKKPAEISHKWIKINSPPTHAFSVRGHWRRIKGFGKNRSGETVKGATWVKPHIRNKDLEYVNKEILVK